MVYRITILPDAKSDLEDALKFYSEVSPKLAKTFGKRLYESIDRIIEAPVRNPKVRGEYRKLNFRQFPFQLIYRIEKDKIIVIAIAHMKRKQFYWKKRL